MRLGERPHESQHRSLHKHRGDTRRTNVELDPFCEPGKLCVRLGTGGAHLPTKSFLAKCSQLVLLVLTMQGNCDERCMYTIHVNYRFHDNSVSARRGGLHRQSFCRHSMRCVDNENASTDAPVTMPIVPDKLNALSNGGTNKIHQQASLDEERG